MSGTVRLVLLSPVPACQVGRAKTPLTPPPPAPYWTGSELPQAVKL